MRKKFPKNSINEKFHLYLSMKMKILLRFVWFVFQEKQQKRKKLDRLSDDDDDSFLWSIYLSFFVLLLFQTWVFCFGITPAENWRKKNLLCFDYCHCQLCVYLISLSFSILLKAKQKKEFYSPFISFHFHWSKLMWLSLYYYIGPIGDVCAVCCMIKTLQYIRLFGKYCRRFRAPFLIVSKKFLVGDFEIF